MWVESPPGCVVGTNVNATDLMTKPLPKLKIQQLRKLMRFKFVENSCTSVEMPIRGNSMEVQIDIIVVGEKQWVHGGRVSHVPEGAC